MVRPGVRRCAAIATLAAVGPFAVGLHLGRAASVTRPPSHEKAIWGPARYHGVSQFPIYHRLRVGIWQTAINWRDTAPTQPAVPTDPNDPAYRWSSDLDFGVAQAERYDIQVAVQLIFTPAWANGGGAQNVPPTDPRTFAQFAVAVARRYPSVHLFMVWGEPIRSNIYLQHPTASPNYYLKHQTAPTVGLPIYTAQQKADDTHYAEIVDATYAALKAVDPGDLVIAGNTTTSGSVDPFNWARWMRLPDGRPPRMDMWGHNPFGTRAPNLANHQIIAGTADMSDLDVFIPWVDKWLERDGRNRGLKLFISEYTAPTDVPSYEFPYHVTRAVQAQWLADALRIVRRWPAIYTLGWISLRDPPPRADGAESRIGLIDAHGVRKPAFYVFERG